MAVMPNLIDFPIDYANIVLSALGITPAISYVTVSPPFKTPGVIMAQSPAAGITINGTVTLTIPGAFNHSGIGAIVFSQPANYVQAIIGP